MADQVVRTRMAPSPTGEMHVGSMATLLKNYAFAKRHGGQFILRIEDTDKVREVEGGVREIQEIIKRYGLDWDEGPGKGGDFGPYIQSERLDIYREKVAELVKNDQAYYCFCSRERLEKVREEQRANKQAPHYDGRCRQLSPEEAQARVAAGEEYVVRLKVPKNQEITFNDLLRGEITFNSDQIDDQVLLKSDGYPTYHLAVVVDDHLMKITHIMRGEEWISSTPKHVLLYKAFNWDLPIFAHIPVFLNPDGKGKMSKRKGTVSAQSFLDRGYLPEAMLNFFMILGWAKADQEEVISLEEYIQEFDPADLSSNSVAFDLKKLDWLNGVYIRKLNVSELIERLKPFLESNYPVERLTEFLPLVQERLVTLTEINDLTDFFFKDIKVDPELLLKKANPELLSQQLKQSIESLEAIDSWQEETIEELIRQLQEKMDWKRGQYFMALRLAVTGRQATPPLFITMKVLGKELVIKRLMTALKLIA